MRESLRRIGVLDPVLRAFVAVGPAQRKRHPRVPRGSRGLAGPLAGAPLAVKDMIDVAGLPTAAGSRAAPPRVPTRTASAVVRLEWHGAIVVGKTATSEWAIGDSGPDRPTPRPINPWHIDRSPGDSSAGSAVAVSAGLVPLALGTDTAGSVRVPAAFTGVMAYKPTAGRVSRRGVVPLAPTLDTVGVLAARPEVLLAAIDALLASADDGLPRLGSPRIGLDDRYLLNDAGVDPRILQRIEALARDLARGRFSVVPTPLEALRRARQTYETIFYAEAARTHRDVPPLIRDGYGPAARSVLERGARISIRELRAARRDRSRLNASLDETLEKIDVLLSPTTPRVAPPVSGDAEVDAATLAPDDQFTFPANLAGLPAISVPCGLLDGLPVGVQLIGRRGTDRNLARLAHSVTDVVGHLPPPPLDTLSRRRSEA